jgi:hypothetical protein
LTEPEPFILAEPEPDHFGIAGTGSFWWNQNRIILVEPEPDHFGGAEEKKKCKAMNSGDLLIYKSLEYFCMTKVKPELRHLFVGVESESNPKDCLWSIAYCLQRQNSKACHTYVYPADLF